MHIVHIVHKGHTSYWGTPLNGAIPHPVVGGVWKGPLLHLRTGCLDWLHWYLGSSAPGDLLGTKKSQNWSQKNVGTEKSIGNRSWQKFGTGKVSEKFYTQKSLGIHRKENVYRKSPKTGLRENLLPKMSWNVPLVYECLQMFTSEIKSQRNFSGLVLNSW